jgi:catechol 2,3-dioxygenase-like lactoylglutathione lyase family enzyme
MKLNHLDLQVPDVVETAAFFARHFGFTIVSNPTSPAIIILQGEDDFSLVLQRRQGTTSYPEGFHIGFLVDEVAAVHAQHERLRAAGAQPGPVRENNRGVMFYLQAPGDVLVEISCRRPGGATIRGARSRPDEA